jgi:hypothetical protein
MEDVFPRREPSIRIYRLEQNDKRDGTRFRKQTNVGQVCLSEARDLLETLHSQFGPGTYLLRGVKSNGTYGPSRVVEIGPRHI